MDAARHITDHRPDDAGRWAGRIIAAFPDLSDVIAQADAALARHADADDMAQWRDAANRMLDANLGAAILRGFADLSRLWPEARAVRDLIAIGQSATHAGRLCGGAVAGQFLQQWRQIVRGTGQARDAEGYCLGVDRLAEAAPEAVPTLVKHLPVLVARTSGSTFFAWVHAGLRAYGHDRRRRLAFFDLDDDFSRQLLAQDTAADDLSRLERRLRAGLLALWAEKRQLSPLETKPADVPVPRRASLAGGILRLPASFPGFSGADATAIFRAATAHAGAHYRFSTALFPLKTLRPLQVALVSLVEDARVEALAIGDYLGLRALWLPFHAHTDPRGTGTNAAGLMARLARALIDPAYEDGDAWVAKGRALFAEARPRLHDPAISREIGGLLGNDLGQMRVQFNIKTYVVEPAYRDDNLALWDFGDQPDAPQDTIELHVGSIGAKPVENDAGDGDPSDERPDRGAPPRVVAMEEANAAEITTYPEWDYALGYERPDWVTLRQQAVPAAARSPGQAPDTDIAQKLARITRNMPIGRRIRQKHLREGETIDLDAAIDFEISRRMRQTPDERVFQRSTTGPRDLAALLLVDLSQSTADRDEEGRTVLSLELEAAGAIGQAMDLAGDALAIDGFCSDGRANVYYTPLKAFSEPFDARVAGRLAGVASGYSTRLGPALRHAVSRLAGARAFRRVLLVLTDGEPSDIDVPDAAYLREDARRVVHGLKRQGIDAFAFGIGGHASTALAGIFGRKRTLYVPRASVLPRRLVQLYDELKK